MDTDATPEPGTTVELETGATVTFQGSVVFAGEPGPDAHLFDIDGTADGDGKAITAWITGLLEDDPFARLETPQGLVDPETDDLGAALDPPLAAD